MDPDVASYYEAGAEVGRLGAGSSRIEFERTKELLERHLPEPPSRVIDVGGGPGEYAAWLATNGYEVELVDPIDRHVEEATRRASGGAGFSVRRGDARRLPFDDASFDAALVLGPLYHLPERTERLRALGEAARVAKPGAPVAVAAISRFASVLDGLVNGYLADPAFRAIVEDDLRSGTHRNVDERPGYFTTAFFHRPEDLAPELEEAGLEVVGVYGVEGPGWLRPERWDDPTGREEILFAARALERDPMTLGMSGHLLAVGRRPAH